MRKNLLIFAIPLIVFLIFVGFFLKALYLDPTYLPSAKINKSFPSFSIEDLKNPGIQHTEAQLKGKTTLVNVWATWCPSCRHEHPELVKLAEQGIPIIGLNYKDDREDAKQYLQQHGDPYQFNIFDNEGRLGFDLGVYGAPETYVVSGEGVILHRLVGVVTEQNWATELKPFFESDNK